MTDKHLKRTLYSRPQVIHAVLILIFFPRITAFQHKRAFFVFRYNAFVPNGYHGNNKNITVLSQMSQTIHPLSFIFLSVLQKEMFETVYC